MKRVVSIFFNDLLTAFRDFMLGYIILAPVLIALVLKLFVPTVEDDPFTFALHESVGQSMIDEFKQYGKVEVYQDIKKLEDRVNRLGDIEGLYQNDKGEYIILREGNEKENVMDYVLNHYFFEGDLDTKFIVSDIGYTISPVASIGGASVILTAIILGGMLLGLSIIDDKEQDTISALNVTPMTRAEYVIGKSLLGFFLVLINTLLTVVILELFHVDLLQILLISMISFGLALIFGFFMGVTSKNQMEGIAVAKIFLFVISLSIIGAVLLPDRFQPLLYWSPYFWSFKGLIDVITGVASWLDVVKDVGIITGITLIFFLLMRKKIVSGLNRSS